MIAFCSTIILAQFTFILGKFSEETLKRLKAMLQELPNGNITPGDFITVPFHI